MFVATALQVIDHAQNRVNKVVVAEWKPIRDDLTSFWGEGTSKSQ
jgi:hypothetical protein